VSDLFAADFLLATYETERLKTLSVWSCFQEADLAFRAALEAEEHGGDWPELPGPGEKPPTERP